MTMTDPAALAYVLSQVRQERDRQDELFGEQNHPDGTGPDLAPAPGRRQPGPPAVRPGHPHGAGHVAAHPRGGGGGGPGSPRRHRAAGRTRAGRRRGLWMGGSDRPAGRPVTARTTGRPAARSSSEPTTCEPPSPSPESPRTRTAGRAPASAGTCAGRACGGPPATTCHPRTPGRGLPSSDPSVKRPAGDRRTRAARARHVPGMPATAAAPPRWAHPRPLLGRPRRRRVLPRPPQVTVTVPCP